MTRVICGVDVCKEWLDAHVAPQGVHWRFPNTPEGIAALADFCHAQGAGLVVMEACGLCARLPFLSLWAAGLQAARVNPRHVRRFAEAMGYLEKTDRIDAAAIAEFGRSLGDRLIVTPPGPEIEQRFQSLAARLRQIVSDTTLNKQRRSATHDAEARASIDEVLELLKRQAKTIEGELASLIDDDPFWARLNEALREMKGVATRSVITLLAELPEIGTLSGKKLAKLAGVAPMADDSGKREGRRRLRGGRANVRRILFIAAGSAAKFHEGLAQFRQRLIDAGKPRLVIRMALARKLLTILNAKARDARKELEMPT